MKKSLLFLFVLSSLTLNAQIALTAKDSVFADKKFFYEQGISFSQFAKQYISFNNSTFTSNLPYLLTGNLVYKHIGFRYGINAMQNNTSTKDDNSNTAGVSPTNTNDTKSSSVDFRSGLFYYKRLTKRLVANAGVDFVYSSFKSDIQTVLFTSFSPNAITTSDSKLKVNNNSLGTGPFISIQYFILPKFSIGTESSFYYFMETSSQTGETITTDDFSGVISTVTQNTSTKSKTTRSEIKVPLTIFLYLRF